VEVLVTYFGSVLRLPGWLRDTAPFRHTPLLPTQEFRLLPVVLLLLVAGVLLGAAFVAFRRRDVPAT